MTRLHRILVGEGSAEPTSAFNFALKLFAPDPVEFYFGVRRSPEGLDAIDVEGVSITANFPGRGMTRLTRPLNNCNFSSYNVSRVLDTKRLLADALIVVATPPDAHGVRSVGTANGPIQSAIDNAPLIIIEEYPDLPVITGAAYIPADKPVYVVPHIPAAYQALSRAPTDIDFACAENIVRLLENDITLQLGVGGIIEALGQLLLKKTALRIVSGAIGTAIRSLQENGCLNNKKEIMGTALVGDTDMINWAVRTKNLRLMPSRTIHNPRWLATLPKLHSVNVALSVDLSGNINAESIGARRISGRGGSPDFSKGASLSPGGNAIVAIRTDRGNSLVEKIEKPTIPGNHVSFIVCEKGVADLRGKDQQQKSIILKNLLG